MKQPLLLLAAGRWTRAGGKNETESKELEVIDTAVPASAGHLDLPVVAPGWHAVEGQEGLMAVQLMALLYLLIHSFGVCR